MVKETYLSDSHRKTRDYTEPELYPKNFFFVPNAHLKSYQLPSGSKDDVRAEAELLASAFANRLSDMHALAHAGVLSAATALAIRDDVSYRFDEAFAAILALEETLDLSEAAVSRAIMQNTLEFHQYNSLVKTMPITHDLEIFSGLMSETLTQYATR